MRSSLTLSLAALLLFPIALRAQYQHCPFDDHAAVLVEPRDAETGELIAGLQINVLELTQAQSQALPISMIDMTQPVAEVNEQPPLFHRFPGAGPGYHHILNYYHNGDLHRALAVQIIDVDGGENGGEYVAVTVTLDSTLRYPLCRAYNRDRSVGNDTMRATVIYLRRVPTPAAEPVEDAGMDVGWTSIPTVGNEEEESPLMIPEPAFNGPVRECVRAIGCDLFAAPDEERAVEEPAIEETATGVATGSIIPTFE